MSSEDSPRSRRPHRTAAFARRPESGGNYKPRRKEPVRWPLAPEHLRPRSLEIDPNETLPRIVLNAPTSHPTLFRKRLGEFDHNARHGDLVEVVLEDGEFFGYGLFNPRAEAVVRMLRRGTEKPDLPWWKKQLTAALELRTDRFAIPNITDAYRIVHAEGDGLPGLVIDRYGDLLSVEAYSLGMYQRAEAIIALLAPLCGARFWSLRTGTASDLHEGFQADLQSGIVADLSPNRPQPPRKVTIQEHGLKFEVDIQNGQKTGFFCDQRDNRKRLAEHCAGKTVLDLCCYSGGFSLAAKVLGKAAEVTGVDLDEFALETARRNARLNRAEIKFAQCDVFSYLRDAIAQGKKWDVVILDPPKLILSRREQEEGEHKYFDINRLAGQVVNPGGMLVSCSCSGLLKSDDFTRIVAMAVPRGRFFRLLNRTGAAPDHPIALNCLETEYLKVNWMLAE